jgi:hypothetical protein
MERCCSRIIPLAEITNTMTSSGGQLTVAPIAPLCVNFGAFERKPFRTIQQLGSAVN